MLIPPKMVLIMVISVIVWALGTSFTWQ